KFIAEKIQQYEDDHSQTFMFGFEESYGYLIKSFVRDKDAIQALVLLAEVAAYYKKQGKTLYDGLQEIFEEYGYYAEKTISVTLSGEKGAEEIKTIMGNLREEAPKEFADVAVTLTEDFQTGKTIDSEGNETAIKMPASDVLKYTLEDETWLAVRPSGTEPKIKFYIGVKGDSHEAAAEKIATYEAAIRKIAE
ncbi:MAG: phospho-sugar mutase, partial [Enterococcus viikkiensis]